MTAMNERTNESEQWKRLDPRKPSVCDLPSRLMAFEIGIAPVIRD